MKVHKLGLDWLAECEEHDEVYWCGDWEAALEAAYGHVAMRHPWVCNHELGYILNNQHRCLTCGATLPPPSNLDMSHEPGDAL